VRRRWAELERLATELNHAEDEAGLPLTRRPDAGFFALAYSWAAGEDLGEVIADDEMSGGDFVRNVKQIIDLLRQIRTVALRPATADAAGAAADRLFRGVVAASSTVGPGGRRDEIVGPGGRRDEIVGLNRPGESQP
jgi:ATP-dependent RNA helicase HelY